MINYLKKLLGLCIHDWELIVNKKIDIFGEDDDSMPIRRRLTTVKQCKKCFKAKSRIIKY